VVLMGLTLAEKIIKAHLLEGAMEPGSEITLKVDQTLTQDATGTMAFLEFEAMGIPTVKPSFCIQYVDHNLLQTDHKNMDDHLFLRTIAAKYGVYFSAPGNGISHFVHMERFTKPGQMLIGADSHTPTSAGSSMISIGAGGLDVSVAMATGKYTLRMPRIVGVKLTNQLKPWCTAKDVILEVLRRINVDGGTGKILEYFGPGVKTLSVEERSTIGNMGAETGATTSVFPSDERTKEYFAAEKREKDFIPLEADSNAEYANIIEIDLSKVEPLIACPYSPGNVKPVREVAGTEAQQVMIGSSTNSGYRDLMVGAKVLEKHLPSFETAFHIIPGSRQILETMNRDNGLAAYLRAGARIAEPSCNACIGMGNAPGTDVISVRTFPRNWEGRSGTEHDQVFLSSPETAVATYLKGKITDPRDLGIAYPKIVEPKEFVIDDRMIFAPRKGMEVHRGPNIKKLEVKKALEPTLSGKVVIKVGDDISTDHILPAGAEILPLRSNIPAISEYVFHQVDPGFPKRCKAMGGGFIIGGKNYGQGSSREHAAIAPMHLGIKAVIAKAFARIHKSNLINSGILPMEFSSNEDYREIDANDELEIQNVAQKIKEGASEFKVTNKTKNRTFSVKNDFSQRQRRILLEGGLLNYTKRMIA